MRATGWYTRFLRHGGLTGSAL